MLAREHMMTDILVIGSGIAGMIAAIEARRRGARVILASKANLGKEASTAFARTFQTNHGDQRMRGAKIPGYDNEPGKYLEDPQLVRTITDQGQRQIENLIELGVPLVKRSSHSTFEEFPVYLVEAGEHRHGGAMVLEVLSKVTTEMGVRAVEGCHVVSLLKDDGRAVGASGLLQDGRWLSIHARAVILASGGLGGLPEVASAPRGVCGNGHAMALRAGLWLKHVEFTNYYPVGLPTPAGQFVHCAPLTLMMERACLRNGNGEDIVRKHLDVALQEAVRVSGVRFELLPRAVATELRSGPVWLDLTGVPAAEWDRLPERNWKQIRRTQVDMKLAPVPVKHLSQASKGGVAVSIRMRTSIEGLFAAGEVCSGWRAGEASISPLPSCLAMGAIAGQSAAADIEGTREPAGDIADEGLEEARALVKTEGRVRPRQIGAAIRRALYRCAGPVRSAGLLAEGRRDLLSLTGMMDDLQCPTVRDLKDALEARAMLLAGRAVVEASIVRTESRNSFYREDFPLRDDAQWLRPLLVSYDMDTDELSVQPGDRLEFKGPATA